ncbi:hypothetical protein J4E81_002664 [Alternaria sp. BMP 2799]|nr:hypothetical protein J4E81_002664 [Alternaria sp. BMP 2799]
MADKNPLVVAVQTELVTTHIAAPPAYPYAFRRAYICGHPDEFVQVSKPADQKGVLHTVIDPKQVERQSKDWPIYTLVRCGPCAIRLREERCKMQESGKGERVRSVAVYQGETMRPDRGLLSEARSGFEAALKELERISCCGGEEEEQWPLMNEIVGNDDDSIRVVRFLDGRRKVESPASSPSPFVHTFGDMWPLRGGGDGEDIGCWANCESCGGGRRRKDSALEVHQNTTPKSKSDKCTRTETGKQHEYLQDLHLDAPRTPLVVTLGPTSDLDWLRFSYLLRNKNLSFDDIAELVSRYVPDDGDLPENDVAQEEVTAVGESDARDKTWRISVRRSGVVEWDVSTLGKEGHASTTSGVGNDRVQSSEPSCGAEVLKTNGIDVCHHGPPQPPNPPETVRIDGTTEQALRQDDVEDLDQSDERRSSEDHEISRSCFSSDSSADSVDFSKAEIGMQVTRMRPTMLSWLRPKRKYDSLQENTRPNSPGTKESSVGLWKRISRTTSHSTMNTTLVGKFDQKLQAKLSNAKLRASGASQIPANECHPAFREQADASNAQADLSTSAHILNAMRSLNSHRASQSVPSDTKPQRGSHNSSFSRPRPCSTHSTNIMPYGFHRPYRPSPLKHVTRVTSLDVNKGLPPLPPEARRLAHQASHARLKDLQAVKKVDIRKAINEYVGEMAKAY